MSCVFCALVEGRIPARKVFEDAEHLAFFPLKHINPGHVLLIPRAHADYIFEMEPAAYQSLWTKAQKLAPAVKRVSGAKRVGLLVEGFSVPHVHVHLIPINALADIDPNREQALPDDEAERLAKAMREAMAEAT